MHGVMAAQLTRFQAKGAHLPHMSSPAAWTALHERCALEWWRTWGQEVPELQRLAKKITPLMIGSGPAERTWKDVDNILTKKRNALSMKTCLDLVFVRTWLRRELKIVTDEELECFKQWETELLNSATLYAGDVEPAHGAARAQRIFEDQFEAWEQVAINGTGGAGPRVLLGDVKRNMASKFRLQVVYRLHQHTVSIIHTHHTQFSLDRRSTRDCISWIKIQMVTHARMRIYDMHVAVVLMYTGILHTTHMTGTTGFYDNGGDPAAPADWEHRKIFGLIWENRRGWRVETKLCSDLTGASANYYINPTLIIMITESTRNRLVVFRSRM